jgi:hypothetical protein
MQHGDFDAWVMAESTLSFYELSLGCRSNIDTHINDKQNDQHQDITA